MGSCPCASQRDLAELMIIAKEKTLKLDEFSINNIKNVFSYISIQSEGLFWFK